MFGLCPAAPERTFIVFVLPSLLLAVVSSPKKKKLVGCSYAEIQGGRKLCTYIFICIYVYTFAGPISTTTEVALVEFKDEMEEVRGVLTRGGKERGEGGRYNGLSSHGSTKCTAQYLKREQISETCFG